MEFGLIGEHLGHSFSKQIHEKVGKYNYELINLTQNDLPIFFKKRDFKAINVTIPYKEKVIPYLDKIDESAAIVGAVNTIINIDDKLIGYNTDVFGFLSEIHYYDLSVKDKNVLILGDGGASKAIKGSLKILEAKNIYVASRHNKKDVISYRDINNHPEIDIVINATPNGMYPNNDDELLIDFNSLPNLECVIDLIYNPLRTKLLIEAEKRHIKAFNGLYMLVAQAYKAIELFIDIDFDNEDIEKTYLELLRANSNIVLIGMPSSGKTSIGNLLKSRLGLKLIDSDTLIEEKEKMNIRDIISLKGEEYFRKLETDLIKEIYKQSGYIFSPGGGVIKKEENIDLLKQNGIIYFINRDLDKLMVTESRPLSDNKEKLEKLYIDRLPLYKKSADYEISNNDELDNVIEEIIRRMKRI